VTSRRRIGTRLLIAAGAGALAAAVWGVGIERHLYVLRRVSVPVLEPGSAPLRVLHLSDIHMAPWQRRRQAWIASLASLRPDLVVNTGDNVGHVDGLRGVRAALAGFRGVPGVFVHGSNDVTAPSPRNPLRYFLGPSRRHRRATLIDPQAMDRFFTDDLGWTALDNTAATIQAAGRRIRAIGVGDAHHGQDRLDLIPGLVAEADPAEFTIGVTHAPYRRVLDALTENGADIVFAGHTHGGQVAVPGFGALVANCDLPLTQAKGLSRWRTDARSIPLHVSAGLGHSIYAPVRFAVRPEATLLTLLPRPE